jgi:alanine racemase
MKNPLNYLKRLSRGRFPYQPLITVEISKKRLLHNLNEFRTIAPKMAGSDIGCVAPVLKSNAYGHGLFEIADILESESTIPFFIVDSYFEAIALRAHGIKTPILIIGYTRPETVINSRLKNIAFAITTIESLRAISKTGVHNAKRPMNIHLKIDTGMHRQGILPEEIIEAIELIKKNPNIVLEGICSHFSDADSPDTSFTEKQIVVWNEIARQFKTEFPSLKYIHLSATDGHRFAKKIEANVSRLGIGLYGLSDNAAFSQKMHLQPVLRMKTIVTGIKLLKEGETTGYGNMFTAWRDTRIATIPVGYFEGLNRKLSNNGSVIAESDGSKSTNTICPIVGRVSMNITTIEIPAGDQIEVGSSIIAISDRASDANSIASIAQKSGTITYEIAVHIPAHLKRNIV